MNPVNRFVCTYQKSSGLIAGFVHMYVGTWSNNKLVHNYTVTIFTFTQQLPTRLYVEAILKRGGGSEKGCIFKNHVRCEGKRLLLLCVCTA
jgi:hypothetical protein